MLALAKTTNEAKLYQTILFWYMLNKTGKLGVIGDSDLSTPIPSHLNHSRAPNAKPEPSDALASQQRTPEHSDSLASSRLIPDLTLIQPFLFLTSSRFPTSTPIPDPTSFDLHSFASVLFPMFHRSRDCGQAKPDCVPPSLNVS